MGVVREVKLVYALDGDRHIFHMQYLNAEESRQLVDWVGDNLDSSGNWNFVTPVTNLGPRWIRVGRGYNLDNWIGDAIIRTYSEDDAALILLVWGGAERVSYS